MVRRLLKSGKREEVEQGLQLAERLGDPDFWLPYTEGVCVVDDGPQRLVPGRKLEQRLHADIRRDWRMLVKVAWCAMRGAGKLQAHREASPHLHIELGPDVRDLEEVRSLPHLTSLRVDGGRGIETIEALRSLTGLNHVSLWASLTQDLTPIAALTELQSLTLRCAAEDLTPLGSCKALTELTLYCHSRNLDALAGCTELRSLTLLGWSDLEQVNALGHLPKLEALRYERCACIENGAKGFMEGKELAEALQWLRESAAR